MDNPGGPDARGRFEARYLAFLETITHLRPSLHRYCARMTGSVLDGEDVVQDALFQAYRKLDTFDDARPLAPWLFRIAHNRCLDLLRRRGVREEAEAAVDTPDSVMPDDPPGHALGRAVEHLVLTLPPMERACVLLKDVFDYSLEDIAELVGSTVGGVKAALHRGRSKVTTSSPPARTPQPRVKNTDVARILDLYVERFNRRDWEGLRELIAADARLRVIDRYAAPLSESPYFGIYDQMVAPWRLAVADVDGALEIIVYEQGAPRAIVHLEVTDDRITRISDYWFAPWMLQSAESVVLSPVSG